MKGTKTLLERLAELYERYLEFYSGESEHDLVVPFSSATDANNVDEARPIDTGCNHFSYFNDSCGEGAIWSAIDLLWDRFDFTSRVAPTSGAASSSSQRKS